MSRRAKLILALAGAFVFSLAITVALVTPGLAESSRRVHKVVIPGEDRFAPFVITIHRGDTVEWVNRDTDNHTVVSNDFFNTAGHNNTDQLLPGTDANGGKPGKFDLTFTQTGTFVYYCRFHSQLDARHQPIAPGPEGGIQDSNGNFGTPMNGIINVVP